MASPYQRGVDTRPPSVEMTAIVDSPPSRWRRDGTVPVRSKAAGDPAQ